MNSILEALRELTNINEDDYSSDQIKNIRNLKAGLNSQGIRYLLSDEEKETLDSLIQEKEEIDKQITNLTSGKEYTNSSGVVKGATVSGRRYSRPILACDVDFTKLEIVRIINSKVRNKDIEDLRFSLTGYPGEYYISYAKIKSYGELSGEIVINIHPYKRSWNYKNDYQYEAFQWNTFLARIYSGFIKPSKALQETLHIYPSSRSDKLQDLEKRKFEIESILNDYERKEKLLRAQYNKDYRNMINSIGDEIAIDDTRSGGTNHLINSVSEVESVLRSLSKKRVAEFIGWLCKHIIELQSHVTTGLTNLEGKPTKSHSELEMEIAFPEDQYGPFKRYKNNRDAERGLIRVDTTEGCPQDVLNAILTSKRNSSSGKVASWIKNTLYANDLVSYLLNEYNKYGFVREKKPLKDFIDVDGIRSTFKGAEEDFDRGYNS